MAILVSIFMNTGTHIHGAAYRHIFANPLCDTPSNKIVLLNACYKIRLNRVEFAFTWFRTIQHSWLETTSIKTGCIYI
jgi:hypothetical protein